MKLLLVTSNTKYDRGEWSFINDKFLADAACAVDATQYLLQANPYDAVVIDNSPAELDGPALCLIVRSYDTKIPVLFIGNDNCITEKIQALDAGADAYISFPLNKEELIAELMSLIRRHKLMCAGNILHLSTIDVDFKNKKVLAGDTLLELRRKEFDLLEYLLLNLSRIVSKEELLEHLWDGGLETRSNTVEVHVKHLRDKLRKYCGEEFVQTRRGFGYVIYG